MEAFEQRQVAINESFDVPARTWSSGPPSASYSAKQSRSRRSYLWRPTKTSATSIKTRQEKSSWRPHEDWPPPMLSECQCLPYSSGHFLFQSVERTMHKRARLRTSENQEKKKSRRVRIDWTKGANDAALGPIIFFQRRRSNLPSSASSEMRNLSIAFTNICALVVMHKENGGLVPDCRLPKLSDQQH